MISHDEYSTPILDFPRLNQPEAVKTRGAAPRHLLRPSGHGAHGAHGAAVGRRRVTSRGEATKGIGDVRSEHVEMGVSTNDDTPIAGWFMMVYTINIDDLEVPLF